MGPGGISLGSYNPNTLTQDQKNWLWKQFGHDGNAPVGYGGEGSAGTTTQPGQYPQFNFDFEKEQANAYEQLKPFYEKIVSFAQGDLDLAKRVLEYTYQTGMRESKAEQTAGQQELANIMPQETAQLATTQNKRGILTSGFGATERGQLSESQRLRQEAIDRAAQSREASLTSSREFGTEEKQKGYEQTAFQSERDRRKEAMDLAQSKAGIESSKYAAQLGQFNYAETQRAQAESDKYKKWMSQQGQIL